VRSLRRHHPVDRFGVLAAAALALLLALLSACGSEDLAGFDGDLDPDLLDELEAKADDRACADYPGGELSGDDLLVLVNKQADRQLAKSWAPADLAPIAAADMMPGRSGELRYGVGLALSELLGAAAGDGFELGVRSAYRSYRTQCLTFSFKVAQHGIDHARRFSAEPGRSQHQLGTTVDITAARIGWALAQSLGDEPEGLWLEANAHRFGFALSYPAGAEEITGYAFEPWHYRYIGLAAAAEMREREMLLEDYLAACVAGDPDLLCPREELPAPRPNQGWIGGECASDADCAEIGGGLCLTGDDGYPGGHCTRACTETCPDRAGLNATTFCVAAPAGDLCHSRCDFELFGERGCREGYACLEGTRPSGSRSAPVCFPE
jgi:D-alanyl-D-alanine carboxypeptidase